MKFNHTLLKAIALGIGIGIGYLAMAAFTTPARADHTIELKAGVEINTFGFCLDEQSAKKLSANIALLGAEGYVQSLESKDLQCYSNSTHPQLPWKGFTTTLVEKAWVVTPKDVPYDFQIWKMKMPTGHTGYTWSIVQDHPAKPVSDKDKDKPYDPDDRSA